MIHLTSFNPSLVATHLVVSEHQDSSKNVFILSIHICEETKEESCLFVLE